MLLLITYQETLMERQAKALTHGFLEARAPDSDH